MRTVRILFLGASKRVSLLERFTEAAARHSIDLKLYSCEFDEKYCPISTLATVIAGPKFLSNEFAEWLHDAVKNHSINIVIPTMDSATVALSRFAELEVETCWHLVSSRSLCESMYDKKLADDFFRQHGIPIPPNTPAHYPKILKPRLGFGAKNIHIVDNAAQYKEQYRNDSEYVVQDFISECEEATVDIYHSPQYGILGYAVRDRIEVSDGEVMVCRARLPRENERLLIEQVANIDGWQGCITLQYLTDAQGNLYVVEINPRFGGGVTCAMEAGLDMATYILLEYFGKPLSPPKALRNIIMSRARRDFFYEY
jgi:carbamoyl-phosphate synthase large subunit